MEEIPTDDSGSLATNILIQPRHARNLCPQAEPWLVDAIAHEAFIVVNGLLAVKAAGVLAGTPLRHEVSAEGEQAFEPGHWYMPANKSHATAIKKAFYYGEVAITLPEVTPWTLVRRVNLASTALSGWDNAELAANLADVTSGLQPGSTLPDGQSKRWYRRRSLWANLVAQQTGIAL